MNKQQRNYVKAQSLLKEWEELLASTETEYLRKNKIFNPDGSKPNRFTQIEDIDLFEKHTKEFSKDTFLQKVWEGYSDAKELFQCARDQLIEAALLLDTSTVPGDGAAGEKENDQ